MIDPKTEHLEKLNAHLRANKISQRAVSEAAEVSQTEVSLWCRGHRQIPGKRARLIHDRLGVPLWLLNPSLWPEPAAPEPAAPEPGAPEAPAPEPSQAEGADQA